MSTRSQDHLPEGVYINPFLERSELIAKTTFTVTENLVLGCLIVIFVVVLFLGNMRSGLVVASDHTNFVFCHILNEYFSSGCEFNESGGHRFWDHH